MRFVDDRFKTDKFKTFKDVFDQFTERNIHKLVSQGYFDHLESPISIGKEANVFSAIKGQDRIILKIYRLSNCDFNKMYSYMKEDPRFVGIKPRRRDVVFAWAKREFINLTQARKAGVNVPTVFGFVKNIVIMELVGSSDPAPKLKDEPPKNPKKFFDEIIENYQKLYAAEMVHGDLSPFNILNNQDHPVFIDMSQSTNLENPHAESYLKRDVGNILGFFSKLGVKSSEVDVLKKIRGKSNG